MSMQKNGATSRGGTMDMKKSPSIHSQDSFDDEKKKMAAKEKEKDQVDPRYQRKVPPSFYEEEQKKFQPLPSHWEVGEKNGKKYYVNHRTKTTSWVDPRTKKTRNHNAKECFLGELPYGWDEEVDDNFGVYYINHLQQSTFADPPWDPRIREQVQVIQEYLDKEIQEQKKHIDQLEKEEKKKIDEAQKRVAALEARKAEIEKELFELRKKALEPQDSDSDSASTASTESSLSEELDDIDKELLNAPVAIPKSREEFEQRLRGLMALKKKLTEDPNQPGFNERTEITKVEEELNRVSNMLQAEAATRIALEEQIRKLKEDMELFFKQPAVPADEASLMSNFQKIKEQRAPRDHHHQEGPPVLTRKTRYEMEMELLALKKKLEAEKEERARLERLKSKLDPNADNTGKVPDWIKQINQVAASSKTLRFKIGQQQKQNPEGLSFRERMLFFASGTVQNQPAAPPMAPKPGRK